MKYPDSVVNEVRDLYRQGKSTREIAKLKGLGKSTVAGMTRGIERLEKAKEANKAKEAIKAKKAKEANKAKRAKEAKAVKMVRLVLPADLWKQVSKTAIDQETTKVDIVIEALKKYFEI